MQPVLPFITGTDNLTHCLDLIFSPSKNSVCVFTSVFLQPTYFTAPQMHMNLTVNFCSRLLVWVEKALAGVWCFLVFVAGPGWLTVP